MVTVTGLITGHYILCCAKIDETLHATVSMMSVHDCLIEKSKSCFFVCFSFFLYFYYYNFSLYIKYGIGLQRDCKHSMMNRTADWVYFALFIGSTYSYNWFCMFPVHHFAKPIYFPSKSMMLTSPVSCYSTNIKFFSLPPVLEWTRVNLILGQFHLGGTWIELQSRESLPTPHPPPLWNLRGIAILQLTVFVYLRVGYSCSALHHICCEVAFHLRKQDSIESVELNSCWYERLQSII